VLKNQLFPSRPHLIMGAREKLIGDVGVDVRLKNLRCAGATICGGRPGLFPLANEAYRGEPQSNGLTVKPMSGEVLAAKELSATDRARAWS